MRFQLVTVALSAALATSSAQLTAPRQALLPIVVSGWPRHPSAPALGSNPRFPQAPLGQEDSTLDSNGIAEFDAKEAAARHALEDPFQASPCASEFVQRVTIPVFFHHTVFNAPSSAQDYKGQPSLQSVSTPGGRGVLSGQ